MACDVPLSTRITAGVNRRLRLLVLAQGRPLCHVLDCLLDTALPAARDLASVLGDGPDEALTAGDDCEGAA